MENIMYGYVRVSSDTQSPNRQVQELMKYGVNERNIIIDVCTGVNFRRNGYNALYNVLLKEGDTLVITSIDRLGRNKRSTERAYNNLVDKGVNIIFLDNPELNSDVCTKKKLSFGTQIAEMEYQNIKTRQREGIDNMPIDEQSGKRYSERTGNFVGRPPIVLPDNFVEIYTKWKSKEMSAKEIAESLNISISTFYNYVNKYESENNNRIILNYD